MQPLDTCVEQIAYIHTLIGDFLDGFRQSAPCRLHLLAKFSRLQWPKNARLRETQVYLLFVYSLLNGHAVYFLDMPELHQEAEKNIIFGRFLENS
jgi:hypothetical protein